MQMRGVQRNPLRTALAIFQVPASQNRQYAQVAYFVVSHSATLLHRPRLALSPKSRAEL